MNIGPTLSHRVRAGGGGRVLNAIAQLRLQMNVTKVEKFVRFSELWRRV